MTQRITPETYQKMNDEFEKQGVPFRINILSRTN